MRKWMSRSGCIHDNHFSGDELGGLRRTGRRQQQQDEQLPRQDLHRFFFFFHFRRYLRKTKFYTKWLFIAHAEIVVYKIDTVSMEFAYCLSPILRMSKQVIFVRLICNGPFKRGGAARRACSRS